VCLAAAEPRPSLDKIDHFVFIVESGFSFDSVFGSRPHVEGQPGAHNQTDLRNYWEYASFYVIQDQFFENSLNIPEIHARLRGAAVTSKIYQSAQDFDTDARNNTLPQVSWLDAPQIAASRGLAGVDFATARINAVARSRSWYQSAIFLAFRDPGSYPDHVKPPAQNLGPRVPSLSIGPWSRAAFHDHKPYSFDSWIRTLENRFHLQPSTPATTFDMYDAFDFAQEIREPVILDGNPLRPYSAEGQQQHFATGWLANVHTCFGTWTLSPGSVVDGYVRDFSDEEIPAPFTDVIATVRDSENIARRAEVVYAGPLQVNYLIPVDTAPGLATVTIRGPKRTHTGTAIIAPVSPGLLSSTKMGDGYAQGFNDTTGEWIPATPPAGSTLRLFGMGFRNRRSLGDVKVTIDGRGIKVLHAGQSPAYANLDELDIEIPAGLAGTGIQLLWLSVEGIRANPVRIDFGSGQ